MRSGAAASSGSGSATRKGRRSPPPAHTSRRGTPAAAPAPPARAPAPPGKAKLTGPLAVCAGTTGPGSTHLVAGLYEASRDHAPVLALSGDMPRKMQGIDFIQTTKPDLLFRDVALYTETIASPPQA